MIKKIIIFFSIVVFSLHFVFSQEALKSTEEEYYDFLSLQGLVERPTLGYRTLSDSVWNLSEDTEHIWQENNLGSSRILWESESQGDNWFSKGFYHGFKYKIYGPEWYNSYNTAAPYGQNDGALWQGRGYNTSLTSGLRFEGYGFELTVKPMITWSQNREFENNNNIYKNPFSYTFCSNSFILPIDNVRRYGDDSFYDFSWGDSELRWTWNTLTFGFGTQSPWLGPAQLNPMLGSNNATPYIKFDAGLRKTAVIIPGIDFYLGDIEGRIWTGMLTESDYFDTNPDNNKRMLNAMSASFNPSFIPGFSVGLNRVFMTYWKTKNLKYIQRLFTTKRSNALSSSGNDEDQKFSIFVDWNFDKIGFEVYGEFGRDDFSANETTNPFHTAIYTVGARQLIPLPAGLTSQLSFEWNNFEMSQDYQMEYPYLGYYAHGFVRQGYTNNGQIIGAGSGAFGNSQFVGYKVFHPKGNFEFQWHRYCPNNNAVYCLTIGTPSGTNTDLFKNWYGNFETYNCFGLSALYFVTNSLSLNANYTYVRISNYNYEMKTIYAGKLVHNNSIQFTVKYNF